MVPYYYTRQQEKLEIAILSMFQHIIVNKYNDLARKSFSKTLRVPIVINQDKDFANWYRNISTKQIPMPLPIGGLRFMSKAMNPNNRTQATYCRQIFSKATEQWIQDIQPTPYTFTYSLQFLTDNKSDYGQITENIIPYFNPFRTLRIKEFDFAPDIERKILLQLESVQEELKDELNAGSDHRMLMTTFTFKADMDLYRPFEIPEMIKYAQMNYRVDDIIDSQQIFVYPDPIAQKEKKAWETLAPSIRTGFTLLKTMARTVVQRSDATGKPTWVDITAPDAIRPIEVPSFDLLHLNFDDDTPNEDDQSGFGRDFVALNDYTRQFVSPLAPGNGQSDTDGYAVDPAVQWNRVLDWFGTNDGLNESPFTFQSILQFKEMPVADTIFQYLVNDETPTKAGVIIPSGEVFFEWGIINSKLYFTFKTYGGNSLFYTFTTKDQLELNNTDIYKFVFILYDNGVSGIFGYTINDGVMIALETDRC